MTDSRIPGFYRLSLERRRAALAERSGVAAEELATLDDGGLVTGDADQIVENAVGVYSLPLGLGLNFRLNDVDYIVPMAVEEPSVIAAASNAARMVRDAGGFRGDADDPVMTAQIEILGLRDLESAKAALEQRKSEIRSVAEAAVPRLVQRGGGIRGMEVRLLRDPELEANDRLVVHLHLDCRDAMGANLVNTVAEAIAPTLTSIVGGRHGLRILTNLCDRRRVRVSADVAFATLGADGAAVAQQIASASRFAELDPYRAATHNKGIMNGVDAVVIATGNDWRGVEAGAHAFAAANGRYRPLATWRVVDGVLRGQIELPLAVGTVGGTLQVHRGARLAQRILGTQSAGTLGMIMASVGLASNLAALRALATEGIQRGHMALHTKAVRGRFAPEDLLVAVPVGAATP